MRAKHLAESRLFRFFLVGSLGFCVDAGAFSLALAAGINPYLARTLSFLVAVLATFVLNKHYTFRAEGRGNPGTYVASQIAGLGLNLAVFSLVIHHPIRLPEQYYLGLAAGSIAAMTLTYQLSKNYVFSGEK